MKKIFIMFFILISSFLFAESIFNTFNYSLLTMEPVHWSPEPGIFTDNIKLEITSDYGKIYYLVNKNLSKAEPVPYTKEIFLKGEAEKVTDYEVIVMLENEDGTINFYSRNYRIDRTNKYKKNSNLNKAPYSKKITNSKSYAKIEYNFSDKKYSININQRMFEFPQKIVNQENNTTIITLDPTNDISSSYMISLNYLKNNKIISEIETIKIDLDQTNPPSFGSLYWGQVYRQNYKIKIKPFDKNDTVYYWYKEFNKDEYIFGPPANNEKNKWILYNDPIELSPKYGMEGICGLAAFSVGKNGSSSKISGPFYFKVDGIDETFEQVFKDETSDIKVVEKRILLNGKEFSGSIGTINNIATLRFTGFDENDKYFFSYEDNKFEGKSDLISCEGDYFFKNIDQFPVEINVFFANGEKIGSFCLSSDKIDLPIPKKYYSQSIDLSSDEIISFYMPENKVKYEVTTNLNKNLIVNSNSKDFIGNFKLVANADEDITFKVRFGAFDKENNLIDESDYYYLRIDKKSQNIDVSADGVDFSLYHNEQQTLKLISPDTESTVFYRLTEDENWKNYSEPLIFYPPSTGIYEIKVYVKSVDNAGNSRENQEPFIIRFDRRGIFVDSSIKFSGNGTESAPFNSIERAVVYAKNKGLKIIYLMSENYNISTVINVDSDIIIEPYNNALRPKINFETKSIWKKEYAWFDLGKNAYLEIRNLDFNILSGNYFIKSENNKIKVYNSNFSITGKDNFYFSKSNQGKIGIDNINFNVNNTLLKFGLFDFTNGNLIVKNIKANINSESINLFRLQNTKNSKIENMNINSIAANQVSLLNMNNSDLVLQNIIFKQSGDFKNTLLIESNNSGLNINESDFLLEGNKTFATKIMDQTQSKAVIKNSLFRIKNSFSVIGFNSSGSELEMEKTMLDIQNVDDYSYGFRLDNSNIKIASSILRNFNTQVSVSFVLNKSNFEGINNSIFNVDVKDKNFAFWINEKAFILSINSLYSFTNIEKSRFIYANNNNYNTIKPSWFSNAVTENITLVENLDKKDSEEIIKDFSEKNIFYDFKDDFNVKDEIFFIPLKDSPLLQGGLDAAKSPLKIPEKDFKGSQRILSGIGIDIGAIQKTGNF
jgi:hypothetical protein